MAQEIFDILVVGAGPVGLIFAHRLAKEYRVLLIEKERTIAPRKSWAVPKKWLTQAGYGAYASNTPKQVGFYSHLGDDEILKTIPKKYSAVTTDENKFYKETVASLKKLGCQIVPNTEINRYQYGNGFIKVTGNRSEFKGRLLLDCSGVNSPFIKRGNNFKHQFYWSVYGQSYRRAKIDPDRTYVVAHVGDYDDRKILINDVPEGGSRYTPWLFIVAPKKYSLEELKSLYSEAVKDNFLKNKLAGCRPVKEKYGWIPAIDVKSRAQNRILSLGDAGALAPWQSGMSFSLMLKKLAVFTNRLKKCLSEDKLDEKSLNEATKLDEKEELSFDFGKLLFLFLMNSSAIEMKKFARALSGQADDFQHLLKFSHLEGSAEEFKIFLQTVLGHFSIKEALEILGRDGWADEIKIGGEIITDFIKGLV